jgi:hypothetical protein
MFKGYWYFVYVLLSKSLCSVFAASGLFFKHKLFLKQPPCYEFLSTAYFYVSMPYYLSNIIKKKRRLYLL